MAWQAWITTQQEREQMTTEANRPELFEVMEEIRERNGGELHPSAVVKAARSKRSPLHHFFSWDNTEAAEMWREEQARQLIRRIKLTVTQDDRPSVRVRAYTNVTPIVENSDEDEPAPPVRAYIPTSQVASTPALRAQQEAALAGELRSVRRRLEDFEVFAGVVVAIDEVV